MILDKDISDQSADDSLNESIYDENKNGIVYLLKKNSKLSNSNKKYQIKYLKMEMKYNKYVSENNNFILENEKLKSENKKSNVKIYKLYSTVILLSTTLSYAGYLLLKKN
jgi:hypothetical protein